MGFKQQYIASAQSTGDAIAYLNTCLLGKQYPNLSKSERLSLYRKIALKNTHCRIHSHSAYAKLITR